MKNEPAFPIIIGEKLFDEGLTIRDWFAGMAALPAIGLAEQFSKEASPMPQAARFAYEFADAMLKQREVSKGE